MSNRHRPWFIATMALGLASGAWACSSSGMKPAGTGGDTGETGGSGGSPGTGGATPGTGGAGGSTGGAPGTGGATGGTGGATGGTGGGTGGGGSGGSLSDGGAPDGGGGGDDAAGGGAFTVTAPWMNGAMIDPMYTCQGGQHFPMITWSGAPAGTMGYAMTFFDTANSLVHIALVNIPAAVHSLPPLPMGSMLGPGSNTTDTTWRGPCPNGNLHTYTLTIYALRTAAFSGGNSNTAIRMALENMSNADVLARARVNGMSNARQQ